VSAYAVMWSGGKDSALALWRARERGLDVRWLLTIHDAATERVRFHATPISSIAAQARAARLEPIHVPTTWEGFDVALREALAGLKRAGCTGLVFGDIHLADVRAWYEERTRAAGLEHVEPLWGDEPGALIREFVSIGGRAVLTCVETSKLDASWIGRVIDDDFVRDVEKTGIDPCGENGEYHSFAFAGRFFTEPLAWRLGERRDDGRFAQVEVLIAAVVRL
jgi:uncharacterized protein (TIGR00290 family)